MKSPKIKVIWRHQQLKGLKFDELRPGTLMVERMQEVGVYGLPWKVSRYEGPLQWHMIARFNLKEDAVEWARSRKADTQNK